MVAQELLDEMRSPPPRSGNEGFVAAVSDLALIILAATEEAFAHDEMSPQRTNDNCRTVTLDSAE